MANPTGESVSDAVRLDFDRRLTLQFADVPGDFATYRGTAAAAAVGTGMRDPIFMHQRQPTGGVRPSQPDSGPPALPICAKDSVRHPLAAKLGRGK
jgi:hypothetical protein